jgi:magnesium transporter
VLIVHYVAKVSQAADSPGVAQVERKILEPPEPLPPGAVWIDMVEPTDVEDKQVQQYLGCKIPTRADPDYAEPPEAYYSEDGVRYLRASVISEAEDTPDITGVTFVICDKTLVTVRYDASDAFEVYGQKLCRTRTAATQPDAVAAGLVITIVNLSARALGKVGANLDQIGVAVFGAEGDNSKRNRIYSTTLTALGREDERISNLRESLLSIQRLLLFLSADGRAADVPKPVREATKSALRDLQSLEEDANFKAQKVQFLLDATLGFINLAQNDIIKLFSVLAVIFMPPTMIASIYGMNFKIMPELEWPWGYPAALILMVLVAVGPYVFFRWKKWL